MKHYLMLAVAVFAISQNAFTKTKTLIHCPVGIPSTFNPGLTMNANDSVGAGHLYNQLLSTDKSGSRLMPELAKSWKVLEQGKRIEFELHPNIKFHTTSYFTPTRTLTSDDVVFTFQRMIDANHPYHKVSNGTYVFFKGSEMGRVLQRVERIDDLRFAFVLNKAYAPLLYQLSFIGFPIFSKEYADQLVSQNKMENIDLFPVGTGGYKFSKYKRDQVVKYEKHEGYFKGAPQMDQLILVPVAEASVRLQKLKSGECHVIDQPHARDVSRIEKMNATKLITATKGSIGFISLNNLKKPFDDARVRRAISLALDKEKYIRVIYNDLATAAIHPMSSFPGYESSERPVQNIEEAKKLMSQAGLKKGFSTELWTLPVDRPYITNGKKLGELIQSDLAKIGVQVKLVTFDWPTYLKKTTQGEHSMAMLGWMNSNGDPDQFLSVNLSCATLKNNNLSRWCKPEFDSLLEQARKEMDEKKRREIYQQAMRLFKNETPWVSLAHGYYYIGTSSKLSGVSYSSFGELGFAKATWLQ